MINRMRKLHLAEKQRRGPRQSPSFSQFTDAMLAGNDKQLNELGAALMQQNTQKDELGQMSEVTHGQVLRALRFFTERYEKMSSQEKDSIRVLVQERAMALQNLIGEGIHSSSEIKGDEKRLLALQFLQEHLSAE